jgi:hypothetical protein
MIDVVFGVTLVDDMIIHTYCFLIVCLPLCDHLTFSERLIMIEGWREVV